MIFRRSRTPAELFAVPGPRVAPQIAPALDDDVVRDAYRRMYARILLLRMKHRGDLSDGGMRLLDRMAFAAYTEARDGGALTAVGDL